MATIKKVGDSYKITVSAGYDLRGKQIRQYMTYKPETGLTQKQIEKEVQRQAVLFEEKCKCGYTVTAVKFEDFAHQWFTEVAD